MSGDRNLQIIKELYAAFARGDMAAIHAKIAPGCTAFHDGIKNIAMMKPSGLAKDWMDTQLMAWVAQSIGEDGKPTATAIPEEMYVSDKGGVVALMKYTAVIKGKSVEGRGFHKWTINNEGLITDYLNQPIDLVGYEENFSA